MLARALHPHLLHPQSLGSAKNLDLSSCLLLENLSCPQQHLNCPHSLLTRPNLGNRRTQRPSYRLRTLIKHLHALLLANTDDVVTCFVCHREALSRKSARH